MASAPHRTADPKSTKNRNKPQSQSKVESLAAKLVEMRSRLAQLENQQREELAKQRKNAQNKARATRTRLLSHFGGIAEMCGLLEYRFNSSKRDNVQDNLCANLLAGALLDLSQRLSISSEEDLQKLAEAGKNYRAQCPDSRHVPPVNPIIALGEFGKYDLPDDEE